MNLKKLYTSFDHNPAAYSGINAFYKSVKSKYPNVKRKEIVEFLKSNDAYTLHEPKLKVKNFRRVYVKGLSYQYGIDLVDLSMYSNENRGYRWLLNVIGKAHRTCVCACVQYNMCTYFNIFIIYCNSDCFSKYVWSFPLKRKTGDEVSRVLDRFFKNNTPQKIEIDLGLS